jgi:LPXTG-motif cell wall-anchored protein
MRLRAIVVALLILMAAPFIAMQAASAHTGAISITCASITVNYAGFPATGTDTSTVTINGTPITVPSWTGATNTFTTPRPQQAVTVSATFHSSADNFSGSAGPVMDTGSTCGFPTPQPTPQPTPVTSPALAPGACIGPPVACNPQPTTTTAAPTTTSQQTTTTARVLATGTVSQPSTLPSTSSLPQTGVNLMWLIVASALVFVGVLLLAGWRKEQRD